MKQIITWYGHYDLLIYMAVILISLSYQGGARMKKILYPASCLIVVSLICSCNKKKVDEYAMITFMMGDVKKNNAEALIGELITQDDVINTGVDSFCDIRIGESVIRIKSMTNLKISGLLRSGDAENTELDLTGGKLLCKPKKLLKSESFIVKTPTAVAAVRGTQFTVEADKLNTTRIKVFKGEVKVVKRVKQLESEIDKVIDYAPVIEQEEKIVITAEEARDAEKVVDRVLREETGRSGDNSGAVMDRVIEKTRKDVVVKKDKIEKFRAEDFTRENSEIIEVERKSREDIRRISIAVKQEKTAPVPEGRLIVTRYDVYFIKEGRVAWDGKVMSEPVRRGDRFFIAAGKYVFCAMSDGPVVWKKELENDGKLELKNGMVLVQSRGRTISIDEATGEVR